MKRDMDLVRSILLKAEEQPAGKPLSDLSALGSDQTTLTEHVWLLRQAHLVEASFPGDSPSHGMFMILRLTPAGHDFVAHARQDTSWAKAKSHATKLGVGLTVEVLKKILTDFAAKALSS
jgi:hypothetical protein